MTQQSGSISSIRKHNRPYTGLWYLKYDPCPLGGIRRTVNYQFRLQLRHVARHYQHDPIFQSGDKLVIVSVKETNRSPLPGRVGWEVKALDQKLNPFEFFWDDETAFRSMWER